MKYNSFFAKNMNTDVALRIVKLLRKFYRIDSCAEVTNYENFPTIIINNEDISDLYKDLYNYEYLSGYPDFKIKVPVLCRMPKTNAAELVIYLYNRHKTQQNEQLNVES